MSSKIKLANDMVPGSAMHPGELIRDELSARGMKQVDLAGDLGIAKNVLSELINGKRNISSDLAVRLEDILGIKAEFWMRYQVTYEIDKIRISRQNLTEKTSNTSKTTKSHTSI